MTDKWKEKNVIILCGLICITLLICGILFWPTLYHYGEIKYGESALPFRVNRITGYTELLYVKDGWRGVRVEKVIKALPIEEKNKIVKIGDFDGKGHYEFIIYNGTIWTIKKIRLSMGAKDEQGKDKWHRIYETFVDIRPFSKISSSIELMDYAPQTFYELHVAEEKKWLITPPGKNQTLFYLGPLDFKPDIKIEEVFGYPGE